MSPEGMDAPAMHVVCKMWAHALPAKKIARGKEALTTADLNTLLPEPPFWQGVNNARLRASLMREYACYCLKRFFCAWESKEGDGWLLVAPYFNAWLALDVLGIGGDAFFSSHVQDAMVGVLRDVYVRLRTTLHVSSRQEMLLAINDSVGFIWSCELHLPLNKMRLEPYKPRCIGGTKLDGARVKLRKLDYPFPFSIPLRRQAMA